jgi:hypothetical protein
MKFGSRSDFLTESFVFSAREEINSYVSVILTNKCKQLSLDSQ